MASIAVVASGAASAWGVGDEAWDVGRAGERARVAFSERASGRPFARVPLEAPRAQRPRRLLELGLAAVVAELDAREPDWRGRRIGVVIGTSSGGLAALERALHEPTHAAAPWSESAYFSPLSAVSVLLGCQPVRLVSLYAACASSTLALGLGVRWLELAACDLVVAGGYDAESDWVGAGFDSLKATSAQPPRPFRAERDGMALGEGVALLALSREAKRSLGFVRGFAASTDAVHITAPDRSGRSLARTAAAALRDAGLSAAAVDFVSVHGTGTVFNDAAEAAALELVFGDRAAALPLHAAKASLGHTLGAAGALETLLALSALRRGVLPASAGSGAAMPGLPSHLLEENRAADVQHCLKLSTAFGGSNAALVLSAQSHPDAPRAPRPVHLSASGAPCTALDPARLEGVLVAPPERLPRSDALSELAVAAAAEALRDARARGIELDPLRTGVVVGSASATLEADAQFGARVLGRGAAHAEPRRFPATSPNACAGHVAIAFALGGPSHSVGAGLGAAAEAVAVARDWIASGDADAILVLSVELAGSTADRALGALGLPAPPTGARGVLLTARASGPVLSEGLLAAAFVAGQPPNPGFVGLEALLAAAGLPSPVAFGTVRAPE
jgi:3-oxoacyl-[acyl-carrier-protein] synthase-1/3-oxoacyl-[acyl-carrier-protein] synthase II